VVEFRILVFVGAGGADRQAAVFREFFPDFPQFGKQSEVFG
jgi:hypothetical protein